MNKRIHDSLILGLVLLPLGFLGVLSLTICYQFLRMQYNSWWIYLTEPNINLLFNISLIFIFLGIIAIVYSLFFGFFTKQKTQK